VRLEQVRATGEPAPTLAGREVRLPPAPWSPSEIEVRGQRLDEAMPRVEQFLDAAARSGHARVRLIHGRGTGTLRRAVRELLDRHPLVTGYETAEPREGGEGVTVATLAVAR
jgi:DNA mismatch repair protein MutS2